MSEDRKNEVFGRDRSDGITRRDVMKDDFGIDVPVDLAPLPSEGRVYGVDSPLYGKHSVEISAMTAVQEDILTSRALIKKGTVITELLRSCILSPGVSPDALLSGDRNAIMVAHRITGYGSEYEASITCGSCGEGVEAEFDLSALPIKKLKIDPTEEGKNEFEFKLPRSGHNVLFKFLTGADENDLLQEADRRRKTMRFAKDTLVTGRLRRAIISVGGISDPNKINIFIRNMPASDSRALRKFMEENEPGIDMKGWTECPACGEQQEVNMPLGAKFFWPDS